MQLNQKHRFTVWGISVGLVAIGFLFLFKTFPQFCEVVYGQTFYPFYQSVRSVLSFVLPAGILFYVPFVFLIILLFRQLLFVFKSKRTIFHFLGFCVALLCFVVSWFYVFWGYNYSRPSLETRLELNIQAPDSIYIFSDYKATVQQLNTIRKAINQSDTIAWYDDSFSKEEKRELSKHVAKFIQPYGYKTNYKGFVWELKPKGLLRRFGSSGMFLPWSGEAYFDSALPNVSRPSTFAHELSHAFGITNEGECNFVAYKACMQSDDALVQYSGALSYYRYAARTAYQTDSLRFRSIEKGLDSLVVADLKSKRKCGLLYPDFFPKARDVFYHNYLKTQGVKTGLKDYSKLYLLEYAWRNK